MGKIVIDARELRQSTGRYVERLLHYLQQIDNENDYTVLIKPEDIDGWVPTNPNFKKLACSTKEFSFSEQTKLKEQIESLSPDLVHFPIVQQPVWYKGRTVTTIHDLTTLRFNNPSKNLLVYKFKQRIYTFVIKKAVNKSKFLITPTKFVKDDLIKFTKINPEKIVVTYESADPITESSEIIPELENKKFLMYVGRPMPHKNLLRLIEAFNLLKETHPELILALAGKKDFNYTQIEKTVTDKGTKDIIFTDFISEGQLRWMYENCTVYVFPSLSEGFGLPGLEAMLHGAPVASSNATCLPEVYGPAAVYFDPLNVREMSETIDKILVDKNLRQKLIYEGSKKAESYSWAKMAEQTLKVYKKALDEK